MERILAISEIFVVLFLLLERRKKASVWERNLVYPAVMVLLLIETVGIDLPGCIKQIILYLLYCLKMATPSVKCR